VDERKSIRDNITMVLGNLAKYLREWGLKSKLCRTSRWDNDPERLVVKQMLLGLRTARCRDAVWQELQFSYDDADCPTLLIEVMVLQLDKFHLVRAIARRRKARIRSQKIRGRHGVRAIISV